MCLASAKHYLSYEFLLMNVTVILIPRPSFAFNHIFVAAGSFTPRVLVTNLVVLAYLYTSRCST